MKERPVIFNGEMVCAILDGRKTQTRRVMKPQPEPCDRGGHWWPSNTFKTMLHIEEQMQNGAGGWGGLAGDACPFGAVGDRLWVRETFAAFDADWKHPGKPHDLKDGPWPNVVYPASVAKIPDGTCRPSIHMPRWASRITLEITAVRVERLNDISHDDAKAEGCCYGRGGGVPDFTVTPADHFPTLWASIYGVDSWSANPWVWVIEFRRVGGA
ncbi:MULTISPECIES: hypothetical protein [Serratia]|uniref:hypothetical protein n=1 Tax=Serratia TaxID=613 RepID=UPI00217BDF6C|nr:hypothetical protein [Serratia marcescens]CAI1581632.1 Uncharacterised protein [Serratia marcescens]